ncbi:MAG: hypothetical protein ACRDPW_03245, partial [Mycobacteriales bacterium]
GLPKPTRELLATGAVISGRRTFELAERLHVSRNRVSRIEHGDIERAHVDTLRTYVEAVGGRLRVEVEVGDERIQLA